MRRRIYRWWLYHGPGFKRLRRAIRTADDILPSGFTMRDSIYTGDGALQAATEVDRLRTMMPPYYVRDIAGERLSVVITNPVNTSLEHTPNR